MFLLSFLSSAHRLSSSHNSFKRCFRLVVIVSLNRVVAEASRTSSNLSRTGSNLSDGVVTRRSWEMQHGRSVLGEKRVEEHEKTCNIVKVVA